MKFKNLHDLYVHELQDLYDAENQLVEAIQEMSTKCSSQNVRRAFDTHVKETQKQIKRLEQIFKDLSVEPGGTTCKGMQGLVREGQSIMKEISDPATLDAALIAASNKIEHYEIAGYGTCRTYAQLLGLKEQARILQETLNEEGSTDKKLTALAEQLNVQAMHSEQRR